MDTVRINQIALQGVEPGKLGLLRALAKKINEKTQKRKPKKNCRHCYGRGYIGFLNGIKGLPVSCRCVFVRKVRV